MNLKKIFEMQVELDDSIIKKHKLENVDLNVERIIALIVEVAEFANEVKSFKYWKKDKTIDDQKVLEEFVDGIHFFTSLALELKVDSNIKSIIVSKDINKQYLSLFNEISNLSINFNQEQLKKSYGIYLGMANLLNLSQEDVVNAYIDKNKVNYQRLSSGY